MTVSEDGEIIFLDRLPQAHYIEKGVHWQPSDAVEIMEVFPTVEGAIVIWRWTEKAVAHASGSAPQIP